MSVNKKMNGKIIVKKACVLQILWFYGKTLFIKKKKIIKAPGFKSFKS